MTINKGDIFQLNTSVTFDYPCLVFQNNMANMHMNKIRVIPIIDKKLVDDETQVSIEYDTEIGTRIGTLTIQAMIDVDKIYFKNKISTLTETELNKVDNVIKIAFHMK